MANGKITYYPQTFRALSLPGGANDYACLNENAFNVGTGDFGVSLLFYVDPLIPIDTNEKLLVGKGAHNLDGLRGWWIGYTAQADGFMVRFNDGNASDVTLTITEATPLYGDGTLYGDGSLYTSTLLQKGEWYWAYFSFDRDSNLLLYLYRFSTNSGVVINCGSLASRPGSWSNYGEFRIGKWSDIGRLFRGRMSYLWIDVGRLIPSAWITKEWTRLYYGLRRTCRDFTEAWLFDDSLVGDSENVYAMIYGSGAPAYVDAPPAPDTLLTAAFTHNYQYGHEEGLDSEKEFTRAEDGTLRSYAEPLNDLFTLPLGPIGFTQKTALLAAWQGQQAVNLYFDETHPSEGRKVLIDSPPTFSSVAAVPIGEYWEGELTLRTVR